MGALTEDHRCPRGRLHRLTDAVPTAAVGGLIGTVLLYLVEEHPVPELVVAAAVLGAVLSLAVRQAVNGRPS
jgi:hypothetical protein